ncbi:UNVERIFIED_CONTAM: hypothetical protein K2H54_050710 [Gekko kuhli]
MLQNSSREYLFKGSFHVKVPCKFFLKKTSTEGGKILVQLAPYNASFLHVGGFLCRRVFNNVMLYSSILPPQESTSWTTCIYQMYFIYLLTSFVLYLSPH